MDQSKASGPTGAFFGDLAGRGREPLLKSASGRIRFDLLDDGRVEHWHVAIDKGDVNVSRRNLGADTVVRLDKVTFEGMAGGSVNATAAVLRGELQIDGDIGLVLLFQRLFPSPPRRTAGASA